MIAVIGAMEVEVEALKKHLFIKEEKVIYGIKVVLATLQDKEVILVLSGVGKVNAAMTTTIVLSHYPIDYVINIGTAGGLGENQEVLDIVVAKHIVQHDYDTSAVDGKEGIGIVSYSDPDLIQKALPLLEQKEYPLWIGTIASGDTFVHTKEQATYIKQHFQDVIACEMEAGAIAYVCNHLQVPCIILRSLSDNVYHTNNAMDFKEYVQVASERSAVFCVNFINRY